MTTKKQNKYEKLNYNEPDEYSTQLQFNANDSRYNKQEEEKSMIDIQLFMKNEEECNSNCMTEIVKQCSYLTRLISSMKYCETLLRNDLSSESRETFSQFCEETYSKQCVEDYIHFICHHSNQIKEIVTDLQKNYNFVPCQNLDKCISSNRHYRNRTTTKQNDNFYTDLFDSMHFNFWHLEQCGLRIKTKNTKQQVIRHTNENYLDCYDSQIEVMQTEIELKKKQFPHFNSTNSKFNIMNNNHHSSSKQDIHAKHNDKRNQIWKIARGILSKYFVNLTEELIEDFALTNEMLFLDKMIVFVQAKGHMINELFEYIEEEEYDTDSIKYLINNIDNFMHIPKHAFEDIQQFVQCYNKSLQTFKKAFSTGIVFWYHPFYKNINDYDIFKQQRWSHQQNDFGGYSVQDLYVEKYYHSLKLEALQSGYITICQFNTKILEKAAKYIQSSKCKQTKCVELTDKLHYGIERGEPLFIQHLHSIILYCDFTDFCTDFRSTFRRLRLNESIQSIKRRNSKYFHTSKALREIVQYYGIQGNANDNGKERGPFYTGISFIVNIPSFSIRLNQPTSTTKHTEIAQRFATRDGCVIELNNGSYVSGGQETFFDSSWISCFPEENERIFFGGRFVLEIESIIIIENANNYQKYMSAFWKFDCMLSGQPTGDLHITQKDIDILYTAIEYGDDYKHNQELDHYIKDTFYLFTQRKTQIVLCLYEIDKIENRSFVELIMHPIQAQRMPIYDPNTNLFKKILFELFPNLNQLVIYTHDWNEKVYSFQISRLLKIMSKVPLDHPFKKLIIKDPWKAWLQKAVIKFELNATFRLELQSKQGWNNREDWLVIYKSTNKSLLKEKEYINIKTTESSEFSPIMHASTNWICGHCNYAGNNIFDLYCCRCAALQPLENISVISLENKAEDSTISIESMYDQMINESTGDSMYGPGGNDI
eukprot:70127_1